MRKTVRSFISGVVAFTLALLSFQSTQAYADNVSSSLLASNTYYVSPTGNDGNSCSSSAPCKTFSKAISKAGAGDTIVALAGTYTQTLEVTKSNITLEGQNAVINMNTTGNFGISIPDTVHNVVVRGFTVIRTFKHAILIQGQSITIENNTVYHSVLENGSLSGGGVSCGNGNWGSAIKAAIGASNVTIRNNTVYQNCGEGIAVTRGSHVLVEDNTVYDNYSVNIYIDNSFDIQVLNNRSYCTKSSGNPMGISLGEEYYSGWGAKLGDVVVSGNEVTNCYIGIFASESNVGGTLNDVFIDQNYIPSGQRRSISLDSTSNSNVWLIKNNVFNDPYIRNPAGVTVLDNNSSTFFDVPYSHWAWDYIDSLYNAGITGGCSTVPLAYCPNSTVTRAQMAIFLLRSIYGSSYSPPSATGSVFNDVPAGSFASAWIEQLVSEGVTAGCGGGNYCPNGVVTRAQMAVFLLRAKYGSSYSPPAATGTVFSDIPSDAFAAAWIEQLVDEGVTSGCGGGEYCPNEYVTRAQMAVFLVRMFSLP